MPQIILAPLKRIGAHAIPSAGLCLNYFPCVVGRDVGCELRVADPMVSRRHCCIDWRDDGPVLEDLGSLNGTEVNGEELTDLRRLAEGDLIQMGGSVFAVRLARPKQSDPPVKTTDDAE
jgi:pSer/pThr/pTyr-binding forkhead associated (FHA) protein